jgi:hypothetical protein
MTDFPRCSVILTYDEDRQRLIVQAVPASKLTAARAGELEAPVLLDEFDFKIDMNLCADLAVAFSI